MTDDRPTYGKILGRNISAARGRLQLSQAAIARRMAALGFDWHQQTAGAIEKGRRRVTAEEILGLSWALQTSIAALMAPAPEDQALEFPSGEAVSIAHVRLSARGFYDGAVTWHGNTPVVSPAAAMPDPSLIEATQGTWRPGGPADWDELR